MGGVTVLLYVSEFFPNISGLCIDSCFSDLNTLLYDFSYKYLTRVKFHLKKFINLYFLVVWRSFRKNIAKTYQR